MSLACSYQWSAVRAYHYKVLRTLELGLVKWGDSFDGFKQPFFIPTNLLPSGGSPSHEKAPEKARKGINQRPSASQQPPRHQICDDWSWYDDYSNEACSKLHICIVCKRPDHQAKHCPKRKFDIPTPPPGPFATIKRLLWLILFMTDLGRASLFQNPPIFVNVSPLLLRC